MGVRGTPLASDLQRVFGARLQSLVAYGVMDGEAEGVHTLALVESLTFQDLAACVPLVPAWRRSGFAVPLILSRDEFLRTLDVFPLEYGEIINRHTVLLGDDPFAGMTVNAADLRRACELHAKSHLIHLREAYLENGDDPPRLGRMMAASSAPLRALLTNLDLLDASIAARAGVTPELVREIAGADRSTIADPSALLARYIGAVERLWREVDQGAGSTMGIRSRRTGIGAPSVRCDGAHRTAETKAWIALVAAFLVAASLAGLTQPAAPPLTGPVNDFANIIDEQTERELDRRIRALQQASGDVVVVATVPSMKGFAGIEELALRMFENGGRGIGQKGKDNGALSSSRSRSGSCGSRWGTTSRNSSPMGSQGETIRDVIRPAFRGGDYSRGILAGTTRLINRIAQRRGVELQNVPREQPPAASTAAASTPGLSSSSSGSSSCAHEPQEPASQRPVGPRFLERLEQRGRAVWRRHRRLRGRIRRFWRRRRWRRIRRVRRRTERRRWG